MKNKIPLLRAIITLIISSVMGYLFYNFGIDYDHGQLLDLKLVITLVLVEVPLLMFTPVFARLILNEHEKHIEEKRILEKKHNAKKINENVFRNLIRVICLEHYPFFENKFGFCIQKTSKKIPNLDDPASIAFNIQLDKLINVEDYFDKMENVITTLEVGEEYLQQNYSEISNMWIKIKHDLDTINKDKQEFCIKVSDKIMNELKKYFKVNPTFRLIPFGQNESNWAYFSDNVPRIVSLLFNRYGQVDFTTDSPVENQFYVNFMEWRMLGFNKKEMLDLGVIKEVFRNVTYDDKLVEKHRDFSLRLIKLNNKIDVFRQQLEKRVVNDIDHQI